MSPTRFWALVAAVVLVLVFPQIARAQAGAAIAGSVKDATGAVLPGVTVEASSPALIEKVRTVVTDDRGEYKIVNLVPGAYSVTFTLPGFATVKREGVELTSGFTATIPAELRVGNVSETITVTGASPTVDLQNTRAQSVLKAEVLDALPSGMKDLTQLASLTLGASPSSGASRNDVGGSSGEQSTGISIHGSRGDDGRTNYDGMNTNVFFGQGGGQQRIMKFNTIGIAETTLDTGGNTADTETGGANVNMIPKDGGNTFRLFSADNFTTTKWSSSHVPDDLVARGTTQGQNSVKRVWDYGVGLGGPIAKDRAWFYTPHRWWGQETYVANTYYNMSTNPLFYVADTSKPAYGWNRYWDSGVRVTWQASSKHKISVSENFQHGENQQFLGFVSPEAATNFIYTPISLTQATWNYPRTNRLLFQAGASFLIQSVSYSNPVIPGAGQHAISEQIGVAGGAPAGFTYGAQNVAQTQNDYGSAPQAQHNFGQRFAMSYVTGSHALKIGVDTAEGIFDTHGRVLPDGVTYGFRGGVPNSLTMWATPFDNSARIRGQGIFVQEQWTINRLTINGGLRYDHFKAFVLPITIPAGPFTPERSYAGAEDLPNYKDITPRFGAAYDLFGTGKTAVKFSWGRYIQGQGGQDASNNSPANSITNSTNRTWNDSFFPVGDPRRGNFVPDCDLRNTANNAECGPVSNTNFGRPVANTTWLPETRVGWGKREFNYQTSVQVQHELRPRFGINIGYFRTDWRNQRITVNTLVGPNDFTSYCVTAPADSRLPAGGGYQICGLRNVVPAKQGQVLNVIDTIHNYGNGRRIDIFNGVDIGFNARFGSKGALLAGGTSLGRQTVDTCYLNDDPQVGGGNRTYGYDASLNSCHDVAPIWAGGGQIKLQGVYPLPWKFQLSGTYKNTPGVTYGANLSMTNAQVAPSLGRNLAACPANATATSCTSTVSVPLVQSSTYFDQRFNQTDLRLSRGFKVGRGRLMGSLELYNLTNNRPATAVNSSYGTAAWLRPTTIQGGRMFKLGGQIDY